MKLAKIGIYKYKFFALLESDANSNEIFKRNFKFFLADKIEFLIKHYSLGLGGLVLLKISCLTNKDGKEGAS